MSKNLKNKLECCHRYMETCSINRQPPGFADFLRGTVKLINGSLEHEYDFYIDKDSHLIFSFLNNSKYIQSYDSSYKFSEEIQPKDYKVINTTIDNLFKQKESFSLITTSFYNFPDNFGSIPQDTKDILRKILTPNDELASRIDKIKKDVMGEEDTYTALHVRTGDLYIHQEDAFNKDRYDEIKSNITRIFSNNDFPNVLLICDAVMFAEKIQNDFPEFKYWNNKKIHLGDKHRASDVNEAIQDTLIDFFLLSGAKKIIGIPGSGFSIIVSEVFDIPYDNIEIRNAVGVFHSP